MICFSLLKIPVLVYSHQESMNQPVQFFCTPLISVVAQRPALSRLGNMLKLILIVEQIPNLLRALFRTTIRYYLYIGLKHLRHIFFPISHEASTHAGGLKESNIAGMDPGAIDVLVQIDLGSRKNLEV